MERDMSWVLHSVFVMYELAPRGGGKKAGGADQGEGSV
jgi:hypothetical protein